MDAILKVFPCVGDMLLVEEAYGRLQDIWPDDPNASEKASGSLGGASKAGTIKLIEIDGEKYWKRVV